MRSKVCAALVSLLVIALVLVPVAACGGGGEKAQFGDLTVENVVERLQDAMQNLKTYQFDMEMTMDLKGMADGQAVDVAVHLKSDGALDLMDRKLRMEMALSAKGKSGGETIDEATKMAVYVVDDMGYVGTADDGVEMSWDRQSMPSGTWEEQNQVEQQMKVLNSSKIKYLRT